MAGDVIPLRVGNSYEMVWGSSYAGHHCSRTGTLTLGKKYKIFNIINRPSDFDPHYVEVECDEGHRIQVRAKRFTANNAHERSATITYSKKLLLTGGAMRSDS